MTPDTARQKQDNARDAEAVAGLYAEEDSDRGFLARQMLALLSELAKARQERDGRIEELESELAAQLVSHYRCDEQLVVVRRQLEALLEAANDVRCYPEGAVGFDELEEQIAKARAVLDAGQEKACPRCFGKGLENQDDRPGILLGPLGEMPCRQCGGSGRVAVLGAGQQ